jgi:hypothetical protein
VRVMELQATAMAGGVQVAEREREGQGFDWSWARREDERGDKKQDEAGTTTWVQRAKTGGNKAAVLGTGHDFALLWPSQAVG